MGSSYRNTRNYENLQRAYFLGDGEYNIPWIKGITECDCDNWISWNYAKGCDEPEIHGVHFFVDDYQFDRVWRNPDAYIAMLQKFRVVCTPDFSPYADFPKAIQIYNHYRKHWLGAYWQMHGITVIPTVTWSSPDTLEWCFDGEPKNSIVAMSSQGMFKNDRLIEWLLVGYEAMVKQIDPIKIIWKGKIPDELEDEKHKIFQIPSFTDKWREERG